MTEDTQTAPPVTRWGAFVAALRRWQNTLFSAADHIWILALWAVSTPLFIHMLGEDLFGVWVMINTLIGLGGVMSFGFGEATTRFVARYRGLDDMETVRAVVETSALLYLLTSALFSAAIWLGAGAMSRSVFDLDGAMAVQATLAVRLAAVALLVTALLKTWEATINGFERFDITARISMVTRSFIIIGNVIMAFLGFGLPALLTMATLGLTGQSAVLWWRVRRSFVPGVRLASWPNPKVTGEILRFGLQSWFQILAGAMANVVDRLLVGALVSPAAAGIYAVCLQLAQQVYLLLYRGLAFMMPASSRDTATGQDIPQLQRNYRSGTVLTLFLVATLSFPLYVLADQLLTIWVGASFAASGADLLRALVIYFGITSAMIPSFLLVNGAGFPGWNSAATMTNGSIILALAFYLLPAMGLDGIALARFLAAPTLLVPVYALHRYVLRGAGYGQSVVLLGGIAGIIILCWLLRIGLSDYVPARILPTIAVTLGLGALGAALVMGPYLVWRRRAIAALGAA